MGKEQPDPDEYEHSVVISESSVDDMIIVSESVTFAYTEQFHFESKQEIPSSSNYHNQLITEIPFEERFRHGSPSRADDNHGIDTHLYIIIVCFLCVVLLFFIHKLWFRKQVINSINRDIKSNVVINHHSSSHGYTIIEKDSLQHKVESTVNIQINVSDIRSRALLKVPEFTDFDEMPLLSDNQNNAHLNMLSEYEKTVVNQLCHTKDTYDYWLNLSSSSSSSLASSSSAYKCSHIHSACTSLSYFHDVIQLRHYILDCQEEIENNLMMYEKSEECLHQLVNEKLKKSVTMNSDGDMVKLLSSKESMLLEAIAVCEEYELHASCHDSYTKAINALHKLHQEEENKNKRIFEQRLQTEAQHLKHSFQSIGLDFNDRHDDDSSVVADKSIVGVVTPKDIVKKEKGVGMSSIDDIHVVTSIVSNSCNSMLSKLIDKQLELGMESNCGEFKHSETEQDVLINTFDDLNLTETENGHQQTNINHGSNNNSLDDDNFGKDDNGQSTSDSAPHAGTDSSSSSASTSTSLNPHRDDTLTLKSMWLLETIRLRRDHMMEYERRKQDRQIEYKKQIEQIRINAKEERRKRVQYLHRQALELQQKQQKHDEIKSADKIMLLQYKNTVNQAFTLLKSIQSRNDVYIWLLGNFLCLGAYSYTSADCNSRKDFIGWISRVLLTVCKHFSHTHSTNNNTANKLLTQQHQQRSAQCQQLLLLSQPLIGSNCNSYISYYSSYSTFFATIADNTARPLMMKLNQVLSNVISYSLHTSLLSSILPAEWNIYLLSVSASLACIIRVSLYFAVPFLIAAVLSYFKCNKLAYWFLFLSGLYSIQEVLLEVVISNIYLWLLIAVHTLIHISLYVFDVQLIWSWNYNNNSTAANNNKTTKNKIIKSIFNFETVDMRWWLIYFCLPITLWFLSLLLGCAESLPESRGIKLSYSKCTSWQLATRCVGNIFLNTECLPIQC